METSSQLTIEDLTQSGKDAIKNQGCKLTKKQIEILVRKAQHIPISFFWESFIKTHGIPRQGDRGFGMNANAFRFYYFQDNC